MNIYDFVPNPGGSMDWSLFETNYRSLYMKLEETPQDPYYHSEGNVWIHTKMVVDALISNIEWQALALEDRQIVFSAALFHDIAKPLCTELLDNGRITSPGHSRKGSIDSRIFFYREGLDFRHRELITRLIGSHQKPFFIMSATDPVFELRKLSREMPLNLLYLLTRADAEGRYTEPATARRETLDSLEYSRMLAEDEGIFEQSFIPADENTWLTYLDRSGVGIDPRFSLYQEQLPFEVVVMSGLPGMGKDRWVSTHRPDLPIVSYDETRDAMGLVYGDDQGQLASMVKEQAKTYLRKRQSFIWNATHISPSMRQKTLGLLHSYGAYVHIVYIEAKDEKTWRVQNKSRAASLPEKALDSMLFKWEVPLENEAHQVDYLVEGTPVLVNRPSINNDLNLSI